MLVLALNLALAELQGVRAGRKPVMLIDDLNAELDHENQDKVVAALVGLGVQVFLTSIAEPKESVQKLAGAMFHVEHGQLIGHA
jgi:recombinational DNA repair ATPase RecF